MKRLLAIDTDPGVDDALAILMCARHPDIDIAALTICGGNVGLDHTTRNAQRLRQLLRLQFPIYAGSALPLLGTAPDAAFVHGSDGFGDASWDEDALGTIENEHAALALIELARKHPQQLEILALGPLSNLALALKLEPKLPKLVKKLTIMGAAFTQDGNITAFAEFNIAVDPEAAQIVFAHWTGANVVDWEATVKFAPSIAWSENAFAGDGNGAQFMRKISRKTLAFKRSIAGTRGMDAPWAWADPLAAFVHLYPQHCQFMQSGLDVVLHGASRGATLMNRRTTQLALFAETNAAEFHACIEGALG
jgi:purine nucleosidase